MSISEEGNRLLLRQDQGSQTDQRKSEISAILEMTKAVRGDVLNLDLEFEAYLFEMAYIAMEEQLQKLS